MDLICSLELCSSIGSVFEYHHMPPLPLCSVTENIFFFPFTFVLCNILLYIVKANKVGLVRLLAFEVKLSRIIKG